MAIYLDNAATSYPKPEDVYSAQDEYLRRIGVNPGRGGYRRALTAEQMIFSARQVLGRLFNIADMSRIVFTANVTEALNLGIKGLLSRGEHVITSHIEHNAVWRPLKAVERAKEIEVTAVPNPRGGRMEPEDVERAFRPDTGLVVINHASNVTGAVMPLAEIGEICRRREVPLLVDSAQTAGAYPIDVEEMNISLLAFTGHKGLLGPTGTGGLYIEKGLELIPLKEGGTGSQSLLETQPEDLPDRFEAGTLNAAGLMGLKAGVEYILNRGVDAIRSHELDLTEFLMEKLEEIPGLTLYGPKAVERRVAVVSFNLEGMAPERIAHILDEQYGIMVRAGLHCSPRAHCMLGTQDRGAVRLSPGIFNTREEIKRAAGSIAEIAEMRG